MENENIDIEEFDRLMRSYITAMLLSNEDEMQDIAATIIELGEDPTYTLLMLSSYGAMTCYLLTLLSTSDQIEQIFTTWSQISQDIEMESILGREI